MSVRLRYCFLLLLACAYPAWADGGRRRDMLDTNKASLREDISRFSADRGRGQAAYPNWAAPAEPRERLYTPQGEPRGPRGGQGGRRGR